MLKPAIAYVDQLKDKFHDLYYSKDMFYYMGGLGAWTPDIKEDNNESVFRWASVDDDDNVVGYIAYCIDWKTGSASDFGLLSFNKGNMILPGDLHYILNSLLENPAVHRIEWRGISGNPVIRTYERFCKKHNGNSVVLHDVTRDDHGNYHDEIIFEIVKGN